MWIVTTQAKHDRVYRFTDRENAERFYEWIGSDHGAKTIAEVIDSDGYLDSPDLATQEGS